MEKDKFSLKEGNTPLVKAIKIPFYLNNNIELYFKREDKNPNGTWIDRYVNKKIESIMLKNSEGILAYGHSREFITSLASYTARLGVNLYLFVSKKEYENYNFSMFLVFDLKIIVVDGEKKDIINHLKKIESIYPLNYVEYYEDNDVIENLMFEVENEIEKVDYVFMNIDKNNTIYYNILYDYFNKKNIKFIGVTLDENISKEKKITLIENYEVEIAYQSLLKNEGIIATKEIAICFAGVDNYDKTMGFEENSNVLQILKKDNTQTLKKIYNSMMIDLNISTIEIGYDNFLEILKLKKIEV